MQYMYESSIRTDVHDFSLDTIGSWKSKAVSTGVGLFRQQYRPIQVPILFFSCHDNHAIRQHARGFQSYVAGYVARICPTD